MLLGLFLSAVLSTGCSADLKSELALADSQMFAGHFAKAKQTLGALLGQVDAAAVSDPHMAGDAAPVLLRLGNLKRLHLADPYGALATYTELIRRFPQSIQALYARMHRVDLLHHRFGDMQAAIVQYHDLIARFGKRLPQASDLSRLQMGLAKAHVAQGEYAAARFVLESLLQDVDAVLKQDQDSARAKTQPASFAARFLIAHTFQLEGDLAKALEGYSALLAAAGPPRVLPQGELAANTFEAQQAQVLLQMGDCLARQNHSERALAYFYASLSAHPNPRAVQIRLQRARARLWQTEPAAGIHLPAAVRRRVARYRAELAEQMMVRKSIKKKPQIAAVLPAAGVRALTVTQSKAESKAESKTELKTASKTIIKAMPQAASSVVAAAKPKVAPEVLPANLPDSLGAESLPKPLPSGGMGGGDLVENFDTGSQKP